MSVPAEVTYLCRRQPKLEHFLATLLPAWRDVGRYRDVRTFLLFIGYPRSGHSLVGSLLNAHRNILMSHELNVMNYARRRFTRAQIYWLLREQDQRFENLERAWTGYDYRVPNQWQGKTEKLLVIGDKHGNGATTVMGQRPESLERLQRTIRVPIKMLHIVRHPLDNIATMQRKNESSLQEALNAYFSLCEVNERLLRDPNNDVLTMHLEDLISAPQQELGRLCGFLDLPADEGYLSDCASIVFPQPKQSRQSVAWPTSALAQVAECSRGFSFLDRYRLGAEATAAS